LKVFSYAAFLPVVLAVTVVRDSRFILGAPEPVNEASSLLEPQRADTTAAPAQPPVNQAAPAAPAPLAKKLSFAAEKTKAKRKENWNLVCF
jgi:hypothetical protein